MTRFALLLSTAIFITERSPIAFWLLSLLVLGLFTGCQPQVPVPARPLVGTWELNQPARLADRINQLPGGLPQPKAESDDPVPADTTRMSLEFRANGILVTRTNMGQLQQEKQGTWEFVAAAADGKKLAVKCLLNRQTTEIEVEFPESNAISLVPPNLAGLNTKLTFRRTQ